MTIAQRSLILLDRDGVLNDVVVHPELGIVDSPLNPDQVQVPPEVPEILAEMTQKGFGLVIVTNQPSAAKGKTTLENLQAVHAKVVSECEKKGGRILKSYVCFHRAEDQCSCRKPKPALLIQALKDFSDYPPSQSWMVGDGITDIEAGQRAGLKTAFLGPRKCDACGILQKRGLEPTLWLQSLRDFWNNLNALVHN